MTVIIKGFKTEALAKEFISWYENQGEQEFREWLGCQDHLTEEEINKGAYVDVQNPNWVHQDEDGNWVMLVK